MSTSTTPTATGNETFMQKTSRMLKNFWASTMACCSNTKEQGLIKKLEHDIRVRKRTFGEEYMTLVEKEATEAELKDCVDRAEADIAKLKEDISKHESAVKETKEDLKKTIAAGSAPATTSAAPTAAPVAEKPETAAEPAPAPAAAAPAPAADIKPGE